MEEKKKAGTVKIEVSGVHPVAVLDDCIEQLEEASANLQYIGMGLRSMTNNSRESNALFPVIRLLDSIQGQLEKVVEGMEGGAI